VRRFAGTPTWVFSECRESDNVSDLRLWLQGATDENVVVGRVFDPWCGVGHMISCKARMNVGYRSSATVRGADSADVRSLLESPEPRHMFLRMVTGMTMSHSGLPSQVDGRLPFATDESGGTVFFDPVRDRRLAIVGPPRSGKSTVIGTLALLALDAGDAVRVVNLSDRPCPALKHVNARTARGIDEARAVISEVASSIPHRSKSYRDKDGSVPLASFERVWLFIDEMDPIATLSRGGRRVGQTITNDEQNQNQFAVSMMVAAIIEGGPRARIYIVGSMTDAVGVAPAQNWALKMIGASVLVLGNASPTTRWLTLHEAEPAPKLHPFAPPGDGIFRPAAQAAVKVTVSKLLPEPPMLR